MSSQRTKFRNAATRVFAKMGDVVIQGTYRQLDRSTYKPGGDGCNKYRDYTVGVIVDQPSKVRNVDSGADNTDIQALITGASLSIQPSVGDRLVLNDLVYHVQAADTDPATALWTLTIKR